MAEDDDGPIVEQTVGHNDEWIVKMQWPTGVTQGGPAAILIGPADPDSVPEGGLSQTVLRQVDFRRATDDLRRQLAVSQQWTQFREEADETKNDLLRSTLSEGVSEEYLALLSSRYARLLRDGAEHPHREIAEVIGKTESTVKGHLWQARKRGLLSGSPGRRAAEVTPEGRAVLGRVLDSLTRN